MPELAATPTIDVFASDRHLARALDCPDDRGGFALAARQANRCLAAAARAAPHQPALVGWHEASQALSLRLKAESATQPALLTSGAQVRALPGYGAWLSALPGDTSEARVQRLFAALGHALAAFAGSGNVLPPALLKGVQACLKCIASDDTASDWHAIANDFPIESAEISTWLARSQRPGIRRMLLALEQARSIPLVHPEQVGGRGTSASTGVDFATAATTSAPEQAADEEPDDDAAPNNLLAWTVQRSNHAGMRAHFGSVGDWDTLTAAELKHVCAGIRSELERGRPAASFALLAVVCLCSSLPSRLAITLPLQSNADIWLASDIGCIHWSLASLLDKAAGSSATSNDPPTHLVVDIALPRGTAAVARTLRSAAPHALSLGELLTGSGEPAAHRSFVERYRAWLRDIGPPGPHRAYDARFAASFSQILRQRHGDVIASWLSLDFREAALGMMHYVRLPRALLHACSDQALTDVGLGASAGRASDGHVGSAVACELDEFELGWRSLQAECNGHRSALARAETLKAAAASHTALATARLAAVVICLAGRGSLLPRLTWSALYAHADFVLLMDKRVDAYSDLRGIPVHALLREQLDDHAEDLKLFAAACRRLGVSPTDRKGRDITRPSRYGSAFFGLRWRENRSSPTLQRTVIGTGSLDRICQHHFRRPANVGRHTLLSAAVSQGWDPWFAKMLGGHHRGHAEPFADGGMVSPAHGLDGLRHALDRTLLRLLRAEPEPAASRFVLAMPELPRRLPPIHIAVARAPGSRARLLGPAWSPSSSTALRIVGLARERIALGEGPSHSGAEALLVGLLHNWIGLDDLRLVWADSQCFRAISERAAAVVWKRAAHAQEQQRFVAPLWAATVWRARRDDGRLPGWAACCEHAARWLRTSLPDFEWPGDDHRCLRVLESLLHLWLRYRLPPFMLSAQSPALMAACPSRSSLVRLACNVPAASDSDEVLLMTPPQTKTLRRSRLRNSALHQILTQIHHFGRTDLQLGEEDQRWHDLEAAVGEEDVAADARAEAIVDVVRIDAKRWRGRESERIQVSSLSTYLYRIAPDLDRIAPSEDLATWQEEWCDWHDGVVKATLARDEYTRAALVEERLVAVRHALRALVARKYPVPPELLMSDGGGATHLATRRAAASTVLFQRDKERVVGLMGRHFAQMPLLAELAQAYATLAHASSLRSAELAVLPLDAVTPFDDLAVDTDGFSHLKSSHARRLQPLEAPVAAEFHRCAAMVRDAEPGARWLFLMADPNDWSTASALSRALGAALRQVTDDPEARQHATRAVAPLARLLPGWEDMARQLALGRATASDCSRFIEAIQRQGVAHLMQVLHAAGHGHPLTFLTYYFAIWPWILAAFVMDSHAGLGDAALFIRNRVPQASAALRKARERARGAEVAFDAWSWLGRHAVDRMSLPKLELSGAPAVHREALPTPAESAQADAPSQILYLAARLMELAPISAAHAFGLSTAAAAAVEPLVDRNAAGELRRRHQADDNQRGRQAEIRLLNADSGIHMAARLAVVPIGMLRTLHDMLADERSVRAPKLPVDDLVARLEAGVGALPEGLALLVQTGAGRYDASELATIASLGPRVHVGRPERDLANRPRVFVVDADAPDNRVRRPRLTSLVRCLVQAAIAIRSKGGDHP